jgi:hypothetical protein
MPEGLAIANQDVASLDNIAAGLVGLRILLVMDRTGF